MKELIRDCNCEDWPCCVHADYTTPTWIDPNANVNWDYPLDECDDYQALPESECRNVGCPYVNECWADEISAEHDDESTQNTYS